MVQQHSVAVQQRAVAGPGSLTLRETLGLRGTKGEGAGEGGKSGGLKKV